MRSILRLIPRRSILGIGAIGGLGPRSAGLNGFSGSSLIIIQISTQRTAQNALSHRLGLPRFCC